jgi:hypothetical protein
MKDLENKIIDYTIKKLNFYEYTKCPYNEIEDSFSLNRTDKINIRNIVALAESYGLIEFSGNLNYSAKLTLKGKEIIENGGWLKHLENKVLFESKEFERLSKNDELLDLDLQLKKFEIRIGKKILIIGFIITFLSFLITIATTKFIINDNNIKILKEIKAK